MKMLIRALLLMIFTVGSLQMASGQKLAIKDSLPVMIYDGKPLIYLSNVADASKVVIKRRIGDSTGTYKEMSAPVYQQKIQPYLDALGRAGVDTLKMFVKVKTDDELLAYIASHRNIKNYSLFVVYPKFAMAAGVAFVDTTLKEKTGKKVFYQMTVNKGQGPMIFQGKFVVGQGLVLPKPRFKEMKNRDSTTAITWGFKRTPGYPPAMVNLYAKSLTDSAFKPAQVMVNLSTRKDSIFFHAISPVKPGVPTAFFIRPVDILDNESIIPSDTVTAYILTHKVLPVMGKVTIKDTTTGIHLKWAALDLGVRSAGVQIQRSTKVNIGFATIGHASARSTEFIDNNVRQGVLYYYRLAFLSPDTTAQKLYGGFGSMKHVSRALLPAPYKVTTVQTATKVKISWSAVPGARGYYVYRASNDSLSDLSSISKLLPDTATSYIDTSKNVSRRNFYYYVVRSLNYAGKESVRSVASAVKFPAGKDALGAPNGLRLHAGESGMHVQWEDLHATDPYVAGYNVYRRRYQSDKVSYTAGASAAELAKKYRFEKLNAKPMWQAAFEDARYTDSVKFQYAISAVDIDGVESSFSAIVSSDASAAVLAQLTAPKALTLTKAQAGGVVLKWQPGTVGSKVSYIVYRRHGTSNLREKIAKVATTTYTDKKVTARQKYIYEVVALLEDEEGPWSTKSIIL